MTLWPYVSCRFFFCPLSFTSVWHAAGIAIARPTHLHRTSRGSTCPFYIHILCYCCSVECANNIENCWYWKKLCSVFIYSSLVYVCGTGCHCKLKIIANDLVGLSARLTHLHRTTVAILHQEALFQRKLCPRSQIFEKHPQNQHQCVHHCLCHQANQNLRF